MALIDNLVSKAAGKVESAVNSVKNQASQFGNAFGENMTAKPQAVREVSARSSDVNKKYSMEHHMYPKDLMSEPYAGNYVVFYINVSDESKLFTADQKVELDPNVEKRYRDKFVGGEINTAGVVAAAATLNIGGGLVKGAVSGTGGGKKGAAGGGTSVFDRVKGAAGAIGDQGLPTLGLAFAASEAPKSYRLQRRLKTAIALHVPNQLSVRYGMQWSEEDTAAVQAIYDTGNAIIGSAVNQKGGLAAMAGGALGSGMAVGKEAMANYGLTKADNAGAVSAAMGIAANPKKEQTFKGVDFRKFTFEYQFFPRDIREAQNVLNIIKEFKLHMHPEFKSELNYIWIYPSEFDIIYYAGGKENLNLHKHTSCILEELSVNYTPNGVYSTFDNGMPTQINVQMTFRELMVLSKETIKEGL